MRSSLVRPILASNTAANFFEKYVSPSATVRCESVPDADARPSVVLESTGTSAGNGPGTVTTGKVLQSWSLYIVGSAYAGSTAGLFSVNNYTDGTSSSGAGGVFFEPDPLMLSLVDPTLQTPVNAPANGSASLYRICARSITTRLIANDLTNQGSVFAASLGNSSYLSGQSSTEFSQPIATFTNTQLLPTSGAITTIPGSYSGKAKDGCYAVHRNAGTFKYFNADTSYAQFLGSGSPGSAINPLPLGSYQFGSIGGDATHPWWNCDDWDMICTLYTGLDPKATIDITVHNVYEMIPEVGSKITSLCRVPNMDVSSMEVIKRLHHEFGQFYPADFNDWGTLWQGAKNFFADNKDLIGSLAGAVPMAGGALQALVKAMPVESKTQRKQNALALQQRSDEDATLRRAQLLNAENMFMGNSTNSGPKQRRTKAGSNVKSLFPPAEVKSCPACKKKFQTRKAMLEHFSEAHTK